MLNSQCKGRLKWPPRRVDSTKPKRVPANAHAHRDFFQARLPWQEMAKLNKGSIFFYHGGTICHPKSCFVTTKLHGTSTCRCTHNAIFSDRAIFKFPAVYIPATLIRPQRGLGSLCQTGKMAALLNSLLFVYKFSFLSKYRI